jgi:signal peptidase I
MHFNFPLILVILTVVSGLIWLIDMLFFARRRKAEAKKMPVLIDYARSFFPILLVVLIIRSFIIQPFRVPTGSLEPTILPNEFVLVNQFAYGLRLPAINTKVFNVGEPKKGDIVVFRFPPNPKVDFIKRVVGTPGDHVVYKNKVLYINGKEMKQTYTKDGVDIEPEGNIPVQVKEENLSGVKHDIILRKDDDGSVGTEVDVVVPKKMYFMMGDNRDGSADSRYWGFVPEANLDGKGFFIWLSWDSSKHRIRWNRVGTKI